MTDFNIHSGKVSIINQDSELQFRDQVFLATYNELVRKYTFGIPDSVAMSTPEAMKDSFLFRAMAIADAAANEAVRRRREATQQGESYDQSDF